MYNTLKINKDGDIEFDSLGGLVFLEDEQSILQMIMHRLSIKKGEIFYDLEFGISTELNRLKKKEKYIKDIELVVVDALIDDPRILEVEVVNLTHDDDRNYVIYIRVHLTDGTILNIDYKM